MNLTISKYLIESKQLRLFAVNKCDAVTDPHIYLSAVLPLLLSQEERITFNFKNFGGRTFLNIDAFSKGQVIYKMKEEDLKSEEVKLFITKSKLKNFGASYHSIMLMDYFNLRTNLMRYYAESEQVEVSIIENPDCVMLLQPLPHYENEKYSHAVTELKNQRYTKILSRENFIENAEVSIHF